jgi:hypothetical protein
MGPEAHLAGTDSVQPGGPADAITRPDLHAAWLTVQDPALAPQTRDESLAFLLRLADQPGHIARVPHRRDPGLLARAHCRDRVQDGGVDQTVAGREPEEGPHRAQFSARPS